MERFVTLCVTLVVDPGKEVGTILGVNTGKEVGTLLGVNTGMS